MSARQKAREALEYAAISMERSGLHNGAQLMREALAALSGEAAAVPDVRRPIETAPKDGTEILGWREDAGWMLIRWTSCDRFCTDEELQKLDEESTFSEGWFYADWVSGGRLDGSEAPTHWAPLPFDPGSGESEPNHQQEAKAIPEGFTIVQRGDEIEIECIGLARATVNVMSMDGLEMLLATLAESLLKRQPATRAEALSELTRDDERPGMYQRFTRVPE